MNKSIQGGTAHKLTKDIKEALTLDSKALTVWESLTPLSRNEWICWVTFVKKSGNKNRAY